MAEITFPKVAVRVVKESGLTELFFTSKNPLMNWSTHLKGDVPVESGIYDLKIVPVPVEQPEPASQPSQPEFATTPSQEGE